MKISELRNSIREMIVSELSEAGEKTALVTTRSGTTAIDYKTPDELRSIGDNTDVISVKTGAGGKIKEAPNPLYKQLADIKDQISRLTKQIERLKSQENELEPALGINEVNSIEEDVTFEFQREYTPAGEFAREFIKNNPEIKGGKLVKALSNDEEFQKAVKQTEKITKKPQKDVAQNQAQKLYDKVINDKGISQRGPKPSPDTIAKKSEKPTTGAPTIKKEPSEKVTKMKSISEPKGVKLSDDEKEAYQRVMSKVDQIKNGTATKRDKQILVQLYGDPYIKGILKKADIDLIDMIKDLKSSLN